MTNKTTNQPEKEPTTPIIIGEEPTHETYGEQLICSGCGSKRLQLLEIKPLPQQKKNIVTLLCLNCGSLISIFFEGYMNLNTSKKKKPLKDLEPEENGDTTDPLAMSIEEKYPQGYFNIRGGYLG